MDINWKDLSVAVGFPCGSMIPWQTTISLVSTAKACERAGIPFGVDVIAGNSVVTAARDLVLTAFLRGNKSRLFWIDSDIVWTPKDFTRILMLSSELPIIGATYPLKTGGKAGTFIVNMLDGRSVDMNPFGCIKVRSYGLGFCCMTREVVQRIADSTRRVTTGVGATEVYSVFRTDVLPSGVARGEDVAFFDDARALGYDVWLVPTIQLGHVGTHVYTSDPVKALGLDDLIQRKE